MGISFIIPMAVITHTARIYLAQDFCGKPDNEDCLGYTFLPLFFSDLQCSTLITMYLIKYVSD